MKKKRKSQGSFALALIIFSPSPRGGREGVSLEGAFIS